MSRPVSVTVLHFVAGKYAGLDYPLEGNPCVVGRSPQLDLVLADDGVSRKHARFYARLGRDWVQDLGSTHGTLVNGAAIDRHCLRPGDRIALGSSLCCVEVRNPASLSSRRAGEGTGPRSDEGAIPTHGELEALSLSALLQRIAAEHASGTLRIRTHPSDRRGTIHVSDGEVRDAKVDRFPQMTAQKALFRILRWTAGTFELLGDPSFDPATAKLDTPLPNLLAESTRQRQAFADLRREGRLPDPEATIRLTSPDPIRWTDLEGDDLEIVQGLAETGSWETLLARSQTDEPTLYERLAALREMGVVEFAHE